LQFELDEHRRWSLWYYGDGSPVPLIRGADIVAWVGEQPITLAELEDSTVGNRRPPGGNAVVVRGRAAGVWVEAEFLTVADRPQAAVTVTLFPDRFLPTITAVRFLKVPHAATLAGDGGPPLEALVNGLSSNDPCRVVTIGGAPEPGEVESHGAAGLTRGGRGLAIAFDGGEPGQARVKLSPDGIEALSDWRPPRPLRPEGDSSRMQLCFAPEGNGLEALAALFVPASRLDQERLWQAVAPAGWCTRSELANAVSEADVIANVEFCAAHFDRRFFRDIELDDGYQTAAGTWEPNERFPHGHRWLTDQIHAKGFKAGLWIAPFAVSEGSGVPAAHPDWLLRDANGPIVCDTREAWGGPVYALDGANPKVQQWLFDLARRVVQTWGYDHVRVDMLRWATLGTTHYGGLTHAEAYRAGLGAIRDGLGTEAFLLASGAPLQHAVGLVNGMRIGPDVAASWPGIQPAARAAGLRSFYQRAAWLNDPDCLVVRPPLSRSAAEVWASLVAISGGVTMFADHLPKLPADRVELLQRTLPVAGIAGRPVTTGAGERQTAPALTAGGEVYDIRGPWRFRTGDDPSYGSREFDEETWETIAVPARWDDAGHPGYVGVAWYRTRFQLPQRTAAATDRRSFRLELGKIANSDETYLNGAKVGQTEEPQVFRRYPVSPDLLNWGGENVVAVRVSGGIGGPGTGGGGGGGGIWSVRRDLPHRVWVAEGASRWWTAVLVNWEDESQDVSLPLAALGITGARFDAYDVWRDAPSASLTDALPLTLEPQSTRVIAIRPAAARPQVIGSTRHVVQGAVDIAEETWDQATRTLKAKATNLDGRAYAITISVPKELTPGACKADVPCSVTRLASGHAVLQWAAGGDGRDIAWELTFRRSAARKKGKG
jgi:hypothetical protein